MTRTLICYPEYAYHEGVEQDISMGTTSDINKKMFKAIETTVNYNLFNDMISESVLPYNRNTYPYMLKMSEISQFFSTMQSMRAKTCAPNLNYKFCIDDQQNNYWTVANDDIEDCVNISTSGVAEFQTGSETFRILRPAISVARQSIVGFLPYAAKGGFNKPAEFSLSQEYLYPIFQSQFLQSNSLLHIKGDYSSASVVLKKRLTGQGVQYYFLKSDTASNQPLRMQKVNFSNNKEIVLDLKPTEFDNCVFSLVTYDPVSNIWLSSGKLGVSFDK